METMLRIKVSHLDVDFVKAIKTLFKKDREIEITISNISIISSSIQDRTTTIP